MNLLVRAGFNMYALLKKCSDLFIKFGGHQQASGFTLKSQNIEKLRERLTSLAEESISIDMLIPKVEIDAELEAYEISPKLIWELSELEPFGQRNPYPVFLLKNARIEEYSYSGHNNKNIKVKIKYGSNVYRGTAFQSLSVTGDYLSDNSIFRIPKYADIAVQIAGNKKKEKTDIQFYIVDLKPSG